MFPMAQTSEKYYNERESIMGGIAPWGNYLGSEAQRPEADW